MVCTLCGTRKARRHCPALHQSICPVCCGTKRLVEIRCPSDCVHLAAAREHPPAVVRRQQERDAAILLPTIHHLSDRQQRLFLLFHAAIAAHEPDGFTRLVDADAADAAGALAATLETSARGVIYEHRASSQPAQRLQRDLTAALEGARQGTTTVPEADAAVALRAIEAGAKDARGAPDDSATAYLDLMRRLMKESGVLEPASAPSPRTSLIVPAT